jgi:hypothetical protein
MASRLQSLFFFRVVCNLSFGLCGGRSSTVVIPSPDCVQRIPRRLSLRIVRRSNICYGWLHSGAARTSHPDRRAGLASAMASTATQVNSTGDSPPHKSSIHSAGNRPKKIFEICIYRVQHAGSIDFPAAPPGRFSSLRCSHFSDRA